MTTYLDFHILQSVPPSNLNRDDTGSPKSAVYGGVRRARASSQSWKRAARREFSAHLDAAELGYRTLRVVELIAGAIQAQAPDVAEADRIRWAEEALKALGIKLKSPAKAKQADAGAPAQLATSEYLIFLSTGQIENLAALAIAADGGPINKAEAKRAATSDHGIDVSLFGRMVADDATLNVDAAVQVAHAISTHAVTQEFDYYTAVDDRNPREETGAGMIGTIEFNSATLYRYATLNVDALRANLGDDEATTRAAVAFFTSFVKSMPTGKQNTFANRTLPSLVAVRVRADQPISLVEAFESPVTADGEGWMRRSVSKLAQHCQDTDSAYGTAGLTGAGVMAIGDLADLAAPLGESMSLDELGALVAGATRAS